MSEFPFSNERPKTLVDILKWRADEQQHNKVAYTYLNNGETEEGSITYGELDLQAQAIAVQLAEEGLRLNDRVLLLFPTGLNYITAFFGCLYAGVIAIPAYPPQRKRYISRLNAIIDDSEPEAILTEKSTLGDLSALFNEQENASLIKTIILNNTTSPSDHLAITPHITLETPAFLQYTSGSTSRPKGVAVSHGNIIYNEEMIRQGMGHDENSTFVSWLPLFHDMGLIGNLLQPIYVGTRCIIMSPEAFLKQPLRWLKAISKYKAHTSGAPNFAYDLCAEQISDEEKQGLDLTHWRVAYNGSESVHTDTLARFFNAFSSCGFKQEAFYPCYGLAEATLFVSGGEKNSQPQEINLDKSALEKNKIIVHTDKSESSKTLVSCGKNWLDQKIIIVNPDTLLPSEIGQVGEVWLAGPNITKGYWQKTEQNEDIFSATLSKFENDTFLRTGDLGFFDQEELFITGRIKDLIVIRGSNHYPQDIELNLSKSHLALANGNGAAFTVEGNSCEQLMITFEVSRSFVRNKDFEEIFEAIRTAISNHHDLQVSGIDLLKPGKIAKTSSGKIQRHLCRKDFLDKTTSPLAQWRLPTISSESIVKEENLKTLFFGPPWNSDAISNWLVSEFSVAMQLNGSDIDVTQSFAYYGLDSFIAVSLTGELSNLIDSELQPIIFWEYPTIRQLSEHLARIVNN